MRKIRLIAAVSIVASGLFAQNTFEVASIRRAADSNGGSISRTSGGLTAHGVPFRTLLEMAYQTRQIDLSRVANSLLSQRFDITATAAKKIEGDQHWEMLRVLLEDRFKLRYHRETREDQLYALIRSKKGTELGPSLNRSTESDCPARPSSNDFCGIKTITGLMLGQRVSMARLALDLSLFAGHPVQDQTGLRELFDFQLKWTPDPYGDNVPLLNGVPINVVGATFRGALQEQLGLQLESRRDMIETLIIDHVEEPSEN